VTQFQDDHHHLQLRLLARIKVEGDPLDPCWRFIGSTDRWGVGRLKVDGSPRPVHRLAYEVFVGPIPPGMELGRREVCPHSWCWNPAHREPMTRIEVLLGSRAITTINMARTQCPKGHPYDETNTEYRRVGRSIGRACKACNARRRRRRRLAATIAEGRAA
jgi:hypothetical protein